MTTPGPSLYVATPCYGGMADVAYVRGLLALKAACTARRVSLRIDLGGGDALISRARATIMARFLASAATHLLFIDADIGFEPEAAFRLLNADRPVIGGVYVHKPAASQNGAPLALEVEPLPGAPLAAGGEFERVASIGAGFLMISRACAQQLADAYPALRAKLRDTLGAQVSEAVMLFEPLIEPGTGRYLADHQAFCRRWRDLGGEIWADRHSRLTHQGEIAYALPDS